MDRDFVVIRFSFDVVHEGCTLIDLFIFFIFNLHVDGVFFIALVGQGNFTISVRCLIAVFVSFLDQSSLGALGESGFVKSHRVSHLYGLTHLLKLPLNLAV